MDENTDAELHRCQLAPEKNFLAPVLFPSDHGKMTRRRNTQHERIVPKTALGERLLEAIAARGIQSINAADELAGLKRGWSSRVINGKSQAARKALEAMAVALGVHYDWLSSGDGPRDLPPAIMTPDPYPERAVACEAARLMGVSDEAIRLVCSVSTDPAFTVADRDFWFERLRDQERLLRLESKVRADRRLVANAPIRLLPDAPHREVGKS